MLFLAGKAMQAKAEKLSKLLTASDENNTNNPDEKSSSLWRSPTTETFSSRPWDSKVAPLTVPSTSRGGDAEVLRNSFESNVLVSPNEDDLNKYDSSSSIISDQKMLNRFRSKKLSVSSSVPKIIPTKTSIVHPLTHGSDNEVSTDFEEDGDISDFTLSPAKDIYNQETPPGIGIDTTGLAAPSFVSSDLESTFRLDRDNTSNNAREESPFSPRSNTVFPDLNQLSFTSFAQPVCTLLLDLFRFKERNRMSRESAALLLIKKAMFDSTNGKNSTDV